MSSDATVLEAADKLAALIHRVAADKERVVMTGEGGETAALVPIEDLKLIEELEDHQDAVDFRFAKEDFERSGERPIPLDEVLGEFGIKR
jgi:prevent-host-death family protein